MLSIQRNFGIISVQLLLGSSTQNSREKLTLTGGINMKRCSTLTTVRISLPVQLKKAISSPSKCSLGGHEDSIQ